MSALTGEGMEEFMQVKNEVAFWGVLGMARHLLFVAVGPHGAFTMMVGFMST